MNWRSAVIAMSVLAGAACAQQPDHLSADVKGRRLFVPALGNHTLEVLDVQADRRIRTITDLAEPQGVYSDPSTNRLFAACAKEGYGEGALGFLDASQVACYFGAEELSDDVGD